MMEALLINFMFTRFINSKFRSVQKKIVNWQNNHPLKMLGCVRSSVLVRWL